MLKITATNVKNSYWPSISETQMVSLLTPAIVALRHEYKYPVRVEAIFGIESKGVLHIGYKEFANEYAYESFLDSHPKLHVLPMVEIQVYKTHHVKGKSQYDYRDTASYSELERVYSNLNELRVRTGIDVFTYGVIMGQALSIYRQGMLDIISAAHVAKKRVHMLGRDMDSIFFALRAIGAGRTLQYLRGLNRNVISNAYPELIRNHLRDNHVREGDILIDTGFTGSIPRGVVNSGFKISAYLMSGSYESYYPLVQTSKLYSSDSHQMRSLLIRFEHGPKNEIVNFEHKEIRIDVVPEFDSPFREYRRGVKWGFNGDWNDSEIRNAIETINRLPEMNASGAFDYWNNPFAIDTDS